MKLLKLLLSTIFVVFLFSSCATIFGGAKYNAHVIVNGSPGAKITYNNRYIGYGTASFKVNRKDANKVTIAVQENGCEEQIFHYTNRGFRGWPFFSSLILWTSFYPGTNIILPWGVALDFVTGAVWKPDVMEQGVMKMDYKNFQYIINYIPECDRTEIAPTKITQNQNTLQISSASRETFVDVLHLKDGNTVKGIIIELDPRKFVKIQNLNNEVFLFTMSDIVRISKEVLEKD